MANPHTCKYIWRALNCIHSLQKSIFSKGTKVFGRLWEVAESSRQKLASGPWIKVLFLPMWYNPSAQPTRHQQRATNTTSLHAICRDSPQCTKLVGLGAIARPVFLGKDFQQNTIFVSVVSTDQHKAHHFATSLSKKRTRLSPSRRAHWSQLSNWNEALLPATFQHLGQLHNSQQRSSRGKNTRTKDRGGGGGGCWAYKREKKGGWRRIWPLGGHSQRIQRANVNSSWRTENRISIRAGSTVRPCHTAGEERTGL